MISASLSKRQITAVLCGGFLGTISRYGLSLLIQNQSGKSWPYDILLINITGAFVLACLTTLADATFLIGPTRRLFLNVGFLGAYTTFSSLALGDVQLALGGQWWSASLYLFASLAGGILAVLLGQFIGQQILRKANFSKNEMKEWIVEDQEPIQADHSIHEQHIDVQDDLLPEQQTAEDMTRSPTS